MNDAKDIKYRKKIQKKNFFNKVVKKNINYDNL